MDFSVIIPIYNEELNIQKLYDRLSDVLGKITPGFELIFVNDGSKDRSLELVRELSTKDDKVKFRSFSRNFGHQIAVTAGLDIAKGEYIVIIDADLQDPPELIFDMYQKAKQGFEVVYAKRRARQGESFLKKFTAKMFYRTLASITNVSIPVDTGDFRLMHRKVLDVLKTMPEQHKFLRGQISWIGFRQTYVEYDRSERNAGETGYTYKKMIRFALDGITSFSNFPLKMASILGFVVSAVSFILICWSLYEYIFHPETIVRGWTSILICVLFIGGIQLLTIGVIGEYIGRISDNVRKRPLYIIDEEN